MGLTRYMSVLMDDAMKQARFFDHEFVMPEHMLLSLLRQYAFCQALQEEGVDSLKMHEDLVGWLAKQERVPENIKYLPEPSSLFKTMFGTACALAAAADRKLVNVPHFVQAMFGLQNSEAAFLLCKNVGDRQGEFLASVDSYYPLENEPGDETLMMGDGYDEDDYDNDYDDEEEEGRSRQPQDWHQLVTCISDQVEEHNPLIGREQELDRTIQVLCRAEKNNPLHIGEPGVGKTALVYGLAKLINENQVPDRLKGARIYGMDMGQMLAGAQYRGDFEKRIKMVMEGAVKEGNTIIYIDEIHNMIGAGRGSDGGPDASNMLKQYLEAGDIRFIGSTTYEEFNRYMAQSKGIVRRFQQIDIKEPTEEEAIKILEGLQYKYNKFHNVTYRKDALEYAVRASAKYISNRCLPDKAIDLMDEAGAYLEVHPVEYRQRSYVTKAIIQQILTKVCKIDAAAIKDENNESLATLRQRILDKIYGQDKAVDKVVEAVMMAKAGLVDDDKPMASLLFVGPTGVGKTEVETNDRRLEVAAQLQHSHVFEDAFLHLLHAVVVVVENALCSFQVEIVLGIFAPRQSYHCLQIVELYAILRTLWVEHIELVEFLTENLCNILRPVLLSRFLLKFLAFRRTFASAKFLLDVLNLLLQEVFALLFIEILASLCADILLQFEQLNLLV